jgi:hypothetical protein
MGDGVGGPGMESDVMAIKYERQVVILVPENGAGFIHIPMGKEDLRCSLRIEVEEIGKSEQARAIAEVQYRRRRAD